MYNVEVKAIGEDYAWSLGGDTDADVYKKVSGRLTDFVPGVGDLMRLKLPIKGKDIDVYAKVAGRVVDPQKETICLQVRITDYSMTAIKSAIQQSI